MRPFAARAALLLASLAFSHAVAAEPWLLTGRIVSVHDGDTVTLLDGQNRQHKIRVDGIDAPELGQAFGKASKQALQHQAMQRETQATCHKEDRYAREVCRVTVDGADLGLQQIDAGMARFFWALRARTCTSHLADLRRRRAAGPQSAARPVVRG